MADLGLCVVNQQLLFSGHNHGYTHKFYYRHTMNNTIGGRVMMIRQCGTLALNCRLSSIVCEIALLFLRSDSF